MQIVQNVILFRAFIWLTSFTLEQVKANIYAAMRAKQQAQEAKTCDYFHNVWCNEFKHLLNPWEFSQTNFVFVDLIVQYYGSQVRTVK